MRKTHLTFTIMKTIEEIINNRGNINSKIPLLPLLEYQYSDIINYISTSNNKELKEDLNDLIILALNHSEYWSELALNWIDNNFEINEEINKIFKILNDKKLLTQKIRHRAFKLSKRYERSL